MQNGDLHPKVRTRLALHEQKINQVEEDISDIERDLDRIYNELRQIRKDGKKYMAAILAALSPLIVDLLLTISEISV